MFHYFHLLICLATFESGVEERNRHIGRLDTQVAELDIAVQDRQRELIRINNRITAAEKLVQMLGMFWRGNVWLVMASGFDNFVLFPESFPVAEYKELNVHEKARFLTLVRAGITSEQKQIAGLHDEKKRVSDEISDARQALDSVIKELETIQADCSDKQLRRDEALRDLEAITKELEAINIDVADVECRRDEKRRILSSLEGDLRIQENTHEALLRRKRKNLAIVTNEFPYIAIPSPRRVSLMDADDAVSRQSRLVLFDLDNHGFIFLKIHYLMQLPYRKN